MFYFSEQDPNFRIKGSRDPLGFQTIWQSLGRTVIKYLSTVSSNLKDFQVLSYAWYFYGLLYAMRRRVIRPVNSLPVGGFRREILACVQLQIADESH